MKKTNFSIGDLSKVTGCNIETIRYYGKIGLLQEADRTSGNQRRYDQDHYQRLLFILHAREIGFSIESIRQLIALSNHPDEPCHQADDIAQKQLKEVQNKIMRLKLLEKELKRMTEQHENHRVHDCKVIEMLASCGACYGEHHRSRLSD